MNIATLFIGALFIASSALADGGLVSNGGGGDRPVTHIIPQGETGALISRGMGPDYLDLIKAFHDEHPEVPLAGCPENQALVFPQPDRKNFAKFDIRVQLSPGFLKRLFVKPASEPQELTIPVLCGSSRLVAAYGTFVIAMTAMLEKDPVGNHLIDRAFELDGAIPVLITDRGTITRAKGGKLAEFTWFNPETGAIHWSPKDACQGVSCLLGRAELSFLRHELAHLLQFRAMRDEFPRERIWHDIRFTAQDQEIQLTVEPFSARMEFHWMQLHTSLNAAFIEGIANALEKGTAAQHPFVAWLGAFNFLAERDGRLCYVYPQQMGEGEAGFEAPAANEVYVSTSLQALFEKQRVERMIHVIDAIAEHAPRNLIEFAIALDKADQSDLGRRWLREYYFVDYVKRANIRPEFEVLQDEGGTKTFCTELSNSALYFSRNELRR